MNDPVPWILGLLRDALGETYKEYYDGDPDLIPAFNLPCIVVELDEDDESPSSNFESDITSTVIVRVLFNKKDDWSNTVDPQNTTRTKLRRAIGAKGDDKRYLPNTVKGALIGKINGDMRIKRNMRTRYGVVIRPKEITTAEGQVTVQVTHTVRH